MLRCAALRCAALRCPLLLGGPSGALPLLACGWAKAAQLLVMRPAGCLLPMQATSSAACGAAG